MYLIRVDNEIAWYAMMIELLEKAPTIKILEYFLLGKGIG